MAFYVLIKKCICWQNSFVLIKLHGKTTIKLKKYILSSLCLFIPFFTLWRGLLKHCFISRRVAVSNPDGVIEIFYCFHPTGRTMGLGSTQSPTEMNTKIISRGGGKDGRCVGLKTLPRSRANCLEIL